QRLSIAEIETRQRDRLLPSPHEGDTRVNVSGDIVNTFRHGFQRMMRQQELPDLQRLMNRDPLSRVLVRPHNIVIPLNELKRNWGKVIDHFAESFPLRVVLAVKKVAKANPAIRLTTLHEIYEYLEIVIVRLLRDGNPGSPEVIDLAQVQI